MLPGVGVDKRAEEAEGGLEATSAPKAAMRSMELTVVLEEVPQLLKTRGLVEALLQSTVGTTIQRIEIFHQSRNSLVFRTEIISGRNGSRSSVGMNSEAHVSCLVR